MRKSLKLLIVTVLAGALALWMAPQGTGGGFVAIYACASAFVTGGIAVYYWLEEK